MRPGEQEGTVSRESASAERWAGYPSVRRHWCQDCEDWVEDVAYSDGQYSCTDCTAPVLTVYPGDDGYPYEDERGDNDETGGR